MRKCNTGTFIRGIQAKGYGNHAKRGCNTHATLVQQLQHWMQRRNRLSFPTYVTSENIMETAQLEMEKTLEGVRTCQDGEITYYHLSDLAKKIGYRNPCCLAQGIRKRNGKVIKRQARNIKNELRPTNFITRDEVYKILCRLRPRVTAGQVYAFFPLASDTVIKFGRTADWKKRNYTGFNRPKQMILLEDVADSIAMETTVLRKLKKHKDFVQRLDLGSEWFETKLGCSEVKQIIMEWI